MEVVAARSYSIYLVHIPVFFGMHEAWFRLHGMVNPDRPQAAAYFAIAALLVGVVAELNHRILERPLRARGKQIAKQYALRRLEVTP
jgi:peptidoglycan/LPS O-acetylase OafA/YrhL